MHITKMQGLGNDYIYLNCLEAVPEDLPGLAVRLSDRHFGVGGDGLIAIRPGVTGDFSMDMYNADGSRGGHVRQRHPVRGQVRVRQGAHP